MAYVLLAAAVIVGIVALILPRFGRDHRLQEVDRFHRAGQITSGWARAGVTQPVLVDDAVPREETAAGPSEEPGHDRDRESAHH